jgi:hypothetical protein
MMMVLKKVNYLLKKTKISNRAKGYQHLYLIDTQAPINYGDVWFKPTGRVNISKCLDTPFCNSAWLNSKDCEHVSKVIASTDTSLGVHGLDKSFVQDFIKNPKLSIHSVTYTRNNQMILNYKNKNKKAAINWWRNLSVREQTLLCRMVLNTDSITCTDEEIGKIFEHELNYKKSKTEFVMKSSHQDLQPELIEILRNCYKSGINSVTFPAHSFDIEYKLSCDDKDYVTFWRASEPIITDRLHVNSEEQTEEPIWKDWYMTINYHS